MRWFTVNTDTRGYQLTASQGNYTAHVVSWEAFSDSAAQEISLAYFYVTGMYITRFTRANRSYVHLNSPHTLTIFL